MFDEGCLIPLRGHAEVLVQQYFSTKIFNCNPNSSGMNLFLDKVLISAIVV